MRDYSSMLELRPSLMGTIMTIGGTAVGIPIDVTGFKDVLATLVAGAVVGSNTNYLDVKLQQSTSATVIGTGWEDIVGEVNATCAFTKLTFAGTSPIFQMGKLYERIGNGLNGKYIRAHATCSGTVGCGIRFSVNFLLGKPNDTLYIQNAVTQATGNSQYTWLV